MRVSMKTAKFPAEGVEDTVSKAVLKLGYLNVKEKQWEVIMSFVKGNDVFVRLTTASGFLRSLCFVECRTYNG